MATATISQDRDEAQAEVFIAAPPERVFEAITNPEQLVQWWGQKGMYRVQDWEADLRPGGKWITRGVGKAGEDFNVSGEYLEVDPPRLLVHTWLPSYKAGAKITTVRWELEPKQIHGMHSRGPEKMGMGTLVKVRHSGFAGDPEAAAGHGQGWIRVMGWMQAFVEDGQTIDTREAVSAV